jgi:hypothetical protein
MGVGGSNQKKLNLILIPIYQISDMLYDKVQKNSIFFLSFQNGSPIKNLVHITTCKSHLKAKLLFETCLLYFYVFVCLLLLQVSTAVSLIHTLCSSLQHERSNLSLPCLDHLVSDIGFQCLTFLSIHDHSFTSSLAVTYLTAAPDLNYLASNCLTRNTQWTPHVASPRTS